MTAFTPCATIRKNLLKVINVSPRSKLISSMFLFGTIGIFVHYLPLPSAFIAMVRGFTGAIFLLLFMALKRQKPDRIAIKNNLPVLLLSGTALGINWILLFEAYNYTTVATATLCYYFAPIIVILVSPLLLREKLTAKKLVCVLIALVGMVFVSGVLEAKSGGSDFVGVLFGLGAACFYASVMILNKKLHDIEAYDRTVMQLGTAGVVILPYVLLTQHVAASDFTLTVVVLLAVVGIVHTGLTYALYFAGMKDLPAQTVAIFSYLDPIVAILLSALFLKEPLGVYGIVGAVLVLGATFISELPDRKK